MIVARVAGLQAYRYVTTLVNNQKVKPTPDRLSPGKVGLHPLQILADLQLWYRPNKTPNEGKGEWQLNTMISTFEDVV